MNHDHLEHRFVENIPDALEPGILYLSMAYATAAHLCCCGCGEEVVTPFSPTDWKMTFDGESITLHPSIGNWNFGCRSHYFIRDGRVVEALPWSDEQIRAGRRGDREAKEDYYDEPIAETSDDESAIPSPEEQGVWSRFRRWIFRGSN